MSISERRQRDRSERHALIIAAARELAEAEGWEAVTTRRLAERVEYSQPVLYSHFEGKDAIVQAVALQGFEELAATLQQARLGSTDEKLALRAVCTAYLEFAATRPALYEAMFVLPTDLKFASAETPSQLLAAFAEFVAAAAPFAAQPDLCAEVTWGALHGMAVLSNGGRIPAVGREARLDLLVSQIIGVAGGNPK